jgi:cation diffusion facilitator family transporter
MIRAALDWLGFGARGHSHVTLGHDGHDHDDHGEGHEHGHTHGVIDPTIATTAKGIRAIKWSFAILAVTAGLQFVVVLLSGSVALLADMIHNVGDASTAVPLWIAFWFARRKPTETFTYGYGKVEDLAGVVVVMIILFSALVAGYETIDRLIHPQALSMLGAVAAAGVVGFLGNEVVAVFRIRVGREIQSAALIADGYHARVDGLTSLAVVLGAAGVWLGFPLADPLVGLVITVMIFGIVWQSARAVFTRLLDGVEPQVTAELRHAIGHVPGIRGIRQLQTRWIGHRLHAEADLVVDASLHVNEIEALAREVRHEAVEHLPALDNIRVAFDAAGAQADHHHGHGHDDHGHDHDHDHDHEHGAHGH